MIIKLVAIHIDQHFDVAIMGGDVFKQGKNITYNHHRNMGQLRRMISVQYIKIMIHLRGTA